MRILRRVPRALGVVVLVTLLLARIATAPPATAAGASAGARSAAACSNERVSLGSGPEVFYAFTLRGRISCGQAQTLIRSYQHRATTGRGCAGRGSACSYQMAGGWWCSLPGYNGGPIDASCCYDAGRYAACKPGSAEFTVRETSPPAGWRGLLHLHAFELPDASANCESSDLLGKGYTRCSVSSSDQFAVPAAWMEAPRVRICAQREELVQPEGEGSACPAFAMNHKVVLAYGEENEVGGIRCVSAPDTLTCTFSSGAEAGQGFRIDSSVVVAVG